MKENDMKNQSEFDQSEQFVGAYCALAVTENRILVLRRFLLNGNEYVDIRWWYRWKNQAEARPSRKGLCIERGLFDAHFKKMAEMVMESEFVPTLEVIHSAARKRAYSNSPVMVNGKPIAPTEAPKQ